MGTSQAPLLLLLRRQALQAVEQLQPLTDGSDGEARYAFRLAQAHALALADQLGELLASVSATGTPSLAAFAADEAV